MLFFGWWALWIDSSWSTLRLSCWTPEEPVLGRSPQQHRCLLEVRCLGSPQVLDCYLWVAAHPSFTDLRFIVVFYKVDCHRPSCLSGPFLKRKGILGVTKGLRLCPAPGTKVSVSAWECYFPQVLWNLGALSTEKTEILARGNCYEDLGLAWCSFSV